MLEKQIESAICKYAQGKGFLTYKFTSPGHASVPDRIFISDEGTVFFVEMKRKGGVPTSGQAREIARLRQQGVAVFIVDNVDHGKHLVDMVHLGLDPRALM